MSRRVRSEGPPKPPPGSVGQNVVTVNRPAPDKSTEKAANKSAPIVVTDVGFNGVQQTSTSTPVAGVTGTDAVSQVGGARARDIKTVTDVATMAYESAQTVMGNRAMGDVVGQLDRIRYFDEGKPRRTFTIVGGGISGLVMAYELEKLGHKVRILEASDRPGGRIDTFRFPDGTYHEAGAMRIPISHTFTRHYIDEFGLKLQPFINTSPEAYIEHNGVKMRAKDAVPDLYKGLTLNPADDPTMLPGDILSAHVQRALDSLTPEERASLYQAELVGKAKDFDKITLGEFLLQHETPEVVKMLGDTTTLRGQYDRSFLFMLRQQLHGNSTGLEEIVGGMDTLPTEVAKHVKAPIEYGTKVLGGREREDGRYELTLSHNGGPPVTEIDDEVVFTLPFTVMRTMDLKGFSPEKMDAIQNLAYGSATKVILDVAQQFWEKEGIHGGASHTDGASGATYYPVNHRVPPRSDSARSEPQDPQKGPAALLASYVWGPDARRATTEAVIKSVGEMEPALLKPGMIKEARRMAWDENPLTLGAFTQPLPGQNGMYAEAIKPEGNVHFAGEHTSLDHGWIQGAIISALRCVEELVTQPPVVPEGSRAS